jgi:hypothetical protein
VGDIEIVEEQFVQPGSDKHKISSDTLDWQDYKYTMPLSKEAKCVFVYDNSNLLVIRNTDFSANQMFKEYYDSIDHYTLQIKLHNYIKDNRVIFYIRQFLNRTIEWGGLYQEVKRGISRGSLLSPLLGAFYLLDLDKRLEEMNIKYFRYVDDMLILAPTRWKLREAIRLLNQTLSELKLEKHPDKTFIGRIEKEFDFLGYHFDPEGLSVVEKTIEKFLASAVRLYGQEQEEPFVSPLLKLYVRRWVRWVRCIASASPRSLDAFKLLSSSDPKTS